MVSRRFIQGRAFMAAAATSLAAASFIAMSATALADDGDAPKCATPNSDGSCPLPGTAVIRSADRGVAQAGPAKVTGAPKGTAWSDGDDASKGAPILIHDGNQSPLCFANAEFDNTACGLG